MRRFKPKDRFSQLASTRMNRIRKLLEYRGFDNSGNRELMCFCYYNSAVQQFASTQDAFNELVDFNSLFKNPLPTKELEGIRSSVDKVGFYKLSAPKISQLLNLSDSEAVETGFFMTKRDINRVASKRATSEKSRSRE